MDSFVNIILSGTIYDLIKKGINLTFQSVFGEFYLDRVKDDSIYLEFLQEINKEKTSVKMKETAFNLLESKNKYTDVFNSELYKTKFSKRMDFLIYKMNSAGKKINLEKLAEFLKFESANELLYYYKHDSEPTFKFCEDVAYKLGVDEEWMKHGEIDDVIYKTCLPRIHEADKITKNIDLKECELHFIIRDVPQKDIVVVCKYNEYKYEYFPCVFGFNSQVGATGSRELLCLYYFIKELDLNDLYNIHIVPNDIVDQILSGKEYCGIIEQYGAKEFIYILDDFLDIYHKALNADKYGDWYGDDFLKVQQIVSIQIKNK